MKPLTSSANKALPNGLVAPSEPLSASTEILATPIPNAPALPWFVPAAAAFATLIGFAPLVTFLFGRTEHVTDAYWARYMFIYSGVLNIVVAAASAVFGVQITAKQNAPIREQAQQSAAKAARLEGNIHALQRRASQLADGSEKASPSNTQDIIRQITLLAH